MTSCALYVRTSTSDKQDTAMQVESLRAYAVSQGWLVVKVYEDKGYTGKNVKRPALQDLLTSIRRDPIVNYGQGRTSLGFEIILIWKFDRLARSLKELLNMIQTFDDRGLKLVSLKDSIDMTTPHGRLMMHIVGAFGQFEADIIRERVQAGVDHALNHGTKSGRPFGAKRIRDDEKIRALYAIHKSYKKVAKILMISRSMVVRSIKEMLQIEDAKRIRENSESESSAT